MNVIFLGDLMLGRGVNETLRDADPEYVWGDVLPVLRQADVRIAHLECVLSDDGMPADKEHVFRSDARNVAALTVAHIDAVSLANNHVFDHGDDAFNEMLGTLNGADVAHAGAGRNRMRAQAPARIEAPQQPSVGMLAVTDVVPEWEAGDDTPGVWYVPIGEDNYRMWELFEHVRATAADFDILVASLHWGSDVGYRPEPGQREFARALIDSGVDVVYGHSPQVFRGVERYRDGVILYGPGSIIHDSIVDGQERHNESFIFEITTDDSQLRSLRMYPVTIADCRVCFTSIPDGEVSGGRMQTLCRELGTDPVWNTDYNALEIIFS